MAHFNHTFCRFDSVKEAKKHLLEDVIGNIRDEARKHALSVKGLAEWPKDTYKELELVVDLEKIYDQRLNEMLSSLRDFLVLTAKGTK